MRTRIKVVEKSNGEVFYIPQIDDNSVKSKIIIRGLDILLFWMLIGFDSFWEGIEWHKPVVGLEEIWKMGTNGGKECSSEDDARKIILEYKKQKELEIKNHTEKEIVNKGIKKTSYIKV